jgi:hypothetical protein
LPAQDSGARAPQAATSRARPIPPAQLVRQRRQRVQSLPAQRKRRAHPPPSAITRPRQLLNPRPPARLVLAYQLPPAVRRLLRQRRRPARSHRRAEDLRPLPTRAGRHQPPRQLVRRHRRRLRLRGPPFRRRRLLRSPTGRRPAQERRNGPELSALATRPRRTRPDWPRRQDPRIRRRRAFRKPECLADMAHRRKERRRLHLPPELLARYDQT